MQGSPWVRTTSVLQTLADWANFDQSTEWQAISTEFRARFTCPGRKLSSAQEPVGQPESPESFTHPGSEGFSNRCLQLTGLGLMM